MSDRKQVNVNEAALDWLREHDQPINDAPQPAATECPQCGGEKNNPCFLWTQTTGWGDVECGPKCANIFHNAPTRREGHSALRVNNGKLETFDPHPTPPASQPTEVARLRGVLTEILSRLPDENTIEALKADKGYGYRQYPMEPTPRDSDIVRWRGVLDGL